MGKIVTDNEELINLIEETPSLKQIVDKAEGNLFEDDIKRVAKALEVISEYTPFGIDEEMNIASVEGKQSIKVRKVLTDDNDLLAHIEHSTSLRKLASKVITPLTEVDVAYIAQALLKILDKYPVRVSSMGENLRQIIEIVNKNQEV